MAPRQPLMHAEIADELYISGVTVKSHIGHIFGKLSLRDRAAAIFYAYDHGIVTPRWGYSPMSPR
jgi:DNA-binding NarL/FixJ family response regulator